jgi:hypothetical protein
MRICNFLGKGVENALHLREIEALAGIDKRILRRMIQAERLEGIPILSDNLHGYYLPGTDCEKAAFIRSMRNRARAITKAADAVERGAKNG